MVSVVSRFSLELVLLLLFVVTVYNFCDIF